MNNHRSVNNGNEICYPAPLEWYVIGATSLIISVVLISFSIGISEWFAPKITNFKLSLVAVGPKILIGLEIAVDTFFPLTSLSIEKFANQKQEEFKIPNPEIDPQSKSIKVLNECCFCENIVSYRVTVQNVFTKSLSEKMHIYLFEASFLERSGNHPHHLLSSKARKNQLSETPPVRRRSSQDKISLKHKGSQTLLTSLRKKDDPEKMPSRNKSRKKDNEFTYINLDPELCLRCSNFGYTKCSLCSAPYCSPRCKSKDYTEHRNQCPERRMEEKQRQEKEQEYESSLKRLREDIERLTDHGLCKICLEEESCVVFDPCGHLCCCNDCSLQLKMCPLCREDVQKSIKVFI